MFYLMTLNTFYIWLYGVRYMVKDHSDSMRGKQLVPLHGLLFLISSKGSFTAPMVQCYLISQGVVGTGLISWYWLQPRAGF